MTKYCCFVECLLNCSCCDYSIFVELLSFYLFFITFLWFSTRFYSLLFFLYFSLVFTINIMRSPNLLYQHPTILYIAFTSLVNLTFTITSHTHTHEIGQKQNNTHQIGIQQPNIKLHGSSKYLKRVITPSVSTSNFSSLTTFMQFFFGIYLEYGRCTAQLWGKFFFCSFPLPHHNTKINRTIHETHSRRRTTENGLIRETAR